MKGQQAVVGCGAMRLAMSRSYVPGPSRTIPAAAGRRPTHTSKIHSSRPASASRVPDRRDTPNTRHTSSSAWWPASPHRSVGSRSSPRS